MGKNRFVKIEDSVKVNGIERHRDPDTRDPEHAINVPITPAMQSWTKEIRDPLMKSSVLQHVIVHLPTVPSRLVEAVGTRAAQEAVPCASDLDHRPDGAYISIEASTETFLHVLLVEKLGMRSSHRFQSTLSDLVN